MFKTVSEIKAAGFLGFVRISDFHASSDYSMIPKQAGIYLILRIAETPAQFLPENPSRMYYKHLLKPTQHSYELALLQGKLAQVKDSLVLYIGKAGGKDSAATLQKRLKDYMDAGRTSAGKSRHKGGRAIWQLEDSESLLVAWKSSSDEEDANADEQRFLDAFKLAYGSFPLANWKR